MKTTLILSLLFALPTWAQTETTVTAEIQETGFRETVSDTAKILIVPLTLKLTLAPASKRMSEFSIEDLKAALANAMWTTSRNHSFYVGIGGEVFSIEDRYLYLPQGGGDVVRYKFIEANTVAAFQIGDDFYVQLKLTLGVGSNAAATADFAQFSDEEKSMFGNSLAWNEPKVERDSSVPHSYDDILNYGAELRIRYKKMKISLISRITPSEYQITGYPASGNVYTYGAARADHIFEKSIRIDQKFLKLGKESNLAAFVSFTLFQDHRQLYANNMVYPNSTDPAVFQSTKINDTQLTPVGVFKVGVSLNISPKGNRYDGQDVGTRNKSIQ